MSESQIKTTSHIIQMTDVDVPSARRANAVSVKGMNWTVQQGEYWLVMGTAGAGKTDLMMMTAGLIPPARGTYRLFGEEMPIFEGEELSTRLRLGLVFDDGRLFNQLTIAQNIALPLQYHKQLSGRDVAGLVAELLELTGLSQWANNTPGAVSWTWQKRAALARAIAMRPEILLLDDPLNGLDTRHETWWLDFLDQLSQGCPWMQGRPTTLVVAAGSLFPWKHRVRQFAVLRRGEFSVIGPRDKLDDTARTFAGEFYHSQPNI
jgi:ABC-type transporter Mla maintaining outer membrane lipid asymmetry ATPase subunit MlaF